MLVCRSAAGCRASVRAWLEDQATRQAGSRAGRNRATGTGCGRRYFYGNRDTVVGRKWWNCAPRSAVGAREGVDQAKRPDEDQLGLRHAAGAFRAADDCFLERQGRHGAIEARDAGRSNTRRSSGIGLVMWPRRDCNLSLVSGDLSWVPRHGPVV